MNPSSQREAYRTKGYALIPGLISREVAMGLLARLQGELARQGSGFAQLSQGSDLLRAPAAEISSNQYGPIAGFLWGMTPAIAAITGEDLLPTYGYLRIYRQGDICRVHGDRLACEHSVSLTLAYSDDQPWALEVSPVRTDKPYQRVSREGSYADQAFDGQVPPSRVELD